MDSKFLINTNSTEETKKVGETIGRSIEPGTIIALTGDLGSGKTCFVQGLAKGLEIPEEYYITSPTFTLINEYAGRCRLFHIDLYRVDDQADLEDLGLKEIMYSDGVVAVEWAEKLQQEELHISGLSLFITVNIKIIDDFSRRVFMSCKANVKEKAASSFILSEKLLKTVNE